MPLKVLEVRLVAHIAGFAAPLNAAAAQTRAFGTELNTLSKTNSQAFQQMSKGALGVGVAMVAGFGVAVAAAARFDKAMSGVQAVASATNSEMRELRDAALEAGEATVFTASEAARAEAELVKAGVSVADVLGGALRGSLDLAAAGQLDLAEAAMITAQSLNIFDLRGSESVHVADLLAAGASKTSADVTQLGDSLRQGGLVAAQYGLSLEDTVGTLGAFADNGLLASDAGTSLKTMLQRLSPISAESAGLMEDIGFSAYDAQGAFIGIQGVAEELKTSLAGMTQQQRDTTLAQLFGSDAVRGANVLYEEGAEGIARYTQAVDDQGAAQRMAAIQLDNLAGDLEALKGSIETALIQGGSGATGVLRGLTQGATGAVNAFNDLPPELQAGAAGFVGVTGAGLATLGMIGSLVPKIRTAREALFALNAEGMAASRTGAFLNTALGVAGRAATVGAAGFAVLGSAMADASRQADELVESLTSGVDTEDLATIQDALRDVNSELGVLDEEWAEFGGGAQKVIEGTAGAFGELLDKAGGFVGLDLDLSDNAILTNAASTKALREEREKLTRQNEHYTSNLAELANKEGLTNQETIKLAKSVGVDLTDSYNDVVPVLQEALVQIRNGTPASEALGKAQATLSDQVESAADQLDAFNDALDSVLASAFGGDKALADIAAGFDDIAEAVAENGTSLDINTEAGRGNLGLLQDQTEAAIDYIRWQKEQGLGTDELTVSLANQRVELAETLRGFGFGEDVIAEYTGVLETASRVAIETPVEVTGVEQAKRDLASMGAAVIELRGRIQAANGPFDKAAAGQFLDRPGAGFARGGITRYAGGGYDPGIYSDGADVVRFAERGTGGESYIPLANDGRRGRALDIWAETGRILGAYANGAIANWSDQIPIDMRAAITAYAAAEGAPSGGLAGTTSGLNAEFLRRFQAFSEAVGGLGIVSGFRTRAQQQVLYAKYRAGTGNLAAKPGTSKHERGLAIDHRPSATPAMKATARQHRLHYPVRGEPWHVEPMSRGGILLADGRRFVPMATGGLLPGTPTGGRDTGEFSNDPAWITFQNRRDAGVIGDDEWASAMRRRLARFQAFSAEWQRAYDELAKIEEKSYDERRAINDLLTEMGRLSYEDQLGNLDRRIAREREGSLAWYQALKEREDFVRAHRQEMIELHNNEFDLGVLSLEQHLGNLDRRLAAEKEFSAEWMALYRQRQQVLEDTSRTERAIQEGLSGAFGSAKESFARQADDYAEALKRRNEAIESEVLRFRDSIREPLLGTASLLSSFGGKAEFVRGDDIVAMLEHRTEAAERFQDALETLQDRGLDNDLVTRLAQGGPENVNLAEALAGGDVGEVNRLLAGLAARGDDLAGVFVDANRAQIEARVSQENLLPVQRGFNELLAEEIKAQGDAQGLRNEARTWAEAMTTDALPGLIGQYGGLTTQIWGYEAAMRAAAEAERSSPYTPGSLPSRPAAVATAAPQAPQGVDQQLLANKDEVGIRNRINDIYTNRNVAVDGHELNRITRQVLEAIVTLDQVRTFVDHLPKRTFDTGGYLPTGWSLAYNGTGRPESVGSSTTVTFGDVNISVPATAGGVTPRDVERAVEAGMTKAFGGLKTLIDHGVH